MSDAPTVPRPARLAGSWYPADQSACRTALGLDVSNENASDAAAHHNGSGAAAPESSQPALFAVAPHAGLHFCGEVQGAVWRSLARIREAVGSVVILSPSHYVPLGAGELVASPWGALETPGGTLAGVPVAGLDRNGREAAELTAAEHGIELLLPGLAATFGADVPVASLVVGPLASRAAAQRAAGRLVSSLGDVESAADGRAVLMLVSSDFTHYGRRFRHEPLGAADRPRAQRVLRADRGLAGLAAAGDLDAYWESISAAPSTVCGRYAIALAREIASEGLYDTVGWGSSVDDHWAGGDFVDYVAYCTDIRTEAPTMKMKPDDDFAPVPIELATQLIAVSRGALAASLGLASAAPALPVTPEAQAVLAEQYGLFVTLSRNGRLRGCIGSIVPREPLGDSIVRVTRQAAFEDPRFPAMQPSEFSQVMITHSILSPLSKAESADDIELGRHGIVLQLRGRSSVYLPEVPLQQGWNLTATLAALARKAGLPDAAVHDPEIEISLFVTQHYGEGLP